MANQLTDRGYFSVIRFASDATRDEAKNVAVVLVDAEGQFGGVMSAPPGAVSPNIRQQGILDSLVEGFKKQFDTEAKPDLARLRQVTKSLGRSVYLTEPRPVAVSDVNTTLQALFRAYCSARPTPRAPTKGVVLDHVLNSLRRWGFYARRGEYFDDFLFDAIIGEGQPKAVIEVLSFATATRDWSSTERDAGHFLYAVEHVNTPAAAVIRAPTEESRSTAQASFNRITRWFDNAGVPVIATEHLEELQALVH
jgi:hypothetical protein